MASLDCIGQGGQDQCEGNDGKKIEIIAETIEIAGKDPWGSLPQVFSSMRMFAGVKLHIKVYGILSGRLLLQ
jgi:hypothetical protein